jgi:hypothetical protein
VKDGLDGIDGGRELEIGNAVKFSDRYSYDHAQDHEDRKEAHFLDLFQKSFHQVDFPFTFVD